MSFSTKDGSGTVITGASDIVATVNYPYVKLAVGTAGSTTAIDATTPLAVVQTGTPALPTGAATLAKQPAIGTAGTSSADVLSVQGIASMTPLKVDGSAVTQPVSASVLPLPTGAATLAKQPALGTAGTPSADVLTVQGSASMTALKVDASATTQPVSVAALPLPTGSATSALQTTGNASLSSIDSKTTVINTGAVTIAAHTNSSPVTQTISAVDVVTATTLGQNSQPIYTGIPTANSTASFVLNAVESTTFQLTGTWVATVQIEVSFDGGTTWYLRSAHQPGTSYITLSFTANGTGTINSTTVTNFRIRCTAYTSGTITIKIISGIDPGMVYIANSVTLSDATIATQKIGITATGHVISDVGIAGVDVIPTAGSLGVLAAVSDVLIAGATSISAIMAGTWVGTITAYVSSDGTNFVSAHAFSIDNMSAQQTFTTNQTLFFFYTGGMSTVRLKMTSYTSGTATVTWRKSAAPSNLRISDAMTGMPVPSMSSFVAGSDGTNTQAVKVNTTGNLLPFVQGMVATGVNVSGNPLLNGGEARDTLGTATISGQVTRQVFDRYGRNYMISPVMNQATSNGTPITTATDTLAIAAPSANFHIVVHRFHVTNASAVTTMAYLRNGITGTKTYNANLQQGGLMSLVIGGRYKTSGGGTPLGLYVTTSAAGSVEYTIDYEIVAD